MSWILATAPLLLLLLLTLLVLQRRSELRAYARSYAERVEAKSRGSDKARLQHPDIDLSQCIGCGACVRACPEDGVLDLLHGQAVVVHGARCVGHGRCADACPTGAIALTLGDLSDRKDLPAITDDLEAVNVPGLFLAGELTGFALVRTAIAHGVRVADAVAKRLADAGATGPDEKSAPSASGADALLDFLIVGSGPAGLACSLQAKKNGLRALTIEQTDRIGGTVAAYPRRKLVMTQPVELPLHGKLSMLSYQKEELVELWETVAKKNQLQIRTGVRLIAFNRQADGTFDVETTAGRFCAKYLCLALGRRGTPRKLDVPGEELPKVAHSLLDAESYRDREVLVVGGGDSAVEAAIGLAEQPGNRVSLSYRKPSFVRLKARNERRLQTALQHKKLNVLYQSEVLAIEPDRVRLRVGFNGSAREEVLRNDEVFVFAGGIPPFELLERAGVSFDPNDRPAPTQPATEGRAVLIAQLLLLTCATLMLGWVLLHNDYYALAALLRGAAPQHAWLRPAGPFGLTFGIIACALMLFNLCYLVRRSLRWGQWLPGTLRLWMGAHVFTGVAAFLCVLMHGGFTLRNAVGGHAMLALGIVVCTGAIGRYLYAFLPRATNGREIDLDEARAQLVSLSTEWERAGRGFAGAVRDEIENLLHAGRWRPGFFARLGAMISGQIRLGRTLRHLRQQGRRGDIPADEVRRAVSLARRAYRISLIVMHYEEVRAVLASWRYFHRWLALLMVLLAAIHIVTAVRFADLNWMPVTSGVAGP
jgi:thioredoxin reductase